MPSPALRDRLSRTAVTKEETSTSPAYTEHSVMQHDASGFGDSALSRCVLFDFLETDGSPVPRWGHSAVLVGDSVYLYGGVSTQTCDDLLCYELGMTCAEVSA